MGKIAFVFAGQGAQSVGMGKDLYDNYPAASAVFELLPQNLRDLMWNGSAEELNQTINTQPCLFATDLACAALLNADGIFADAAAGFSLGEIPALAYSGVMTREQAFDFVCFRAKTMHQCAEQNKGAMFALLKLSADDVREICARVDRAYPVNYNCPGQTVVACAEESAGALQEAAVQKGGRVMKLAVSGAFHSPFMAEASEEISSFLADQSFGVMKTPVYANATAKLYDNPRTLLSFQVKSPVLWQKTIENMITDGIDTFIEVGPGKTLSGLIKKTDGNVKIFNVCDVETLKNTVSEVQNA